MDKIDKAFALFDEYNKRSPEHIIWDGEDFPIEYFYSLKLYKWVQKLEPHASESLLLASRSQHIGRWEIPRNSYPEGRVGYLKWRQELSRFHAAKATALMAEAGYDRAEQDKVKEIILKQKLKLNPDVQTIENALCLVFLEFQFDDLISRQSEEKMIDILRKTWAKMSEPGQTMALTLNYSPAGKALLEKALG
jgi:hypothetical protein